jgi:AcrR family transcriptional regulator
MRSEMPIRPLLDPQVVAAFRRRRISEAMAELCVERGYRATTVAHIARRSGSSKATLYEHFANREQVFLGLLDLAIANLLERTEIACGTADPESRIEAGLAAILAWVAEEPTFAWVCLVESLCATPASLGLYLETINRFTALLHDAAPSEVPRPETTEESLVGGASAILSGVIRRGEAGHAPRFLRELTAFLERPFLAIGSENQGRDR